MHMPRMHTHAHPTKTLVHVWQYSVPWAVSTALIVVFVSYTCLSILLAILFSLPKYQTLKKNLQMAYILWLCFGILGEHIAKCVERVCVLVCA